MFASHKLGFFNCMIGYGFLLRLHVQCIHIILSTMHTRLLIFTIIYQTLSFHFVIPLPKNKNHQVKVINKNYQSISWAQSVDCISILGPRAYHGTSTINHIIYVIGGFDGVEYFNSVRSFNPMTKDWKEKAPMNNKRYNPKLRACVDQQFFVFCLARGTLLVSNLSKQCSGGSRAGGYKHCNILSLNIL